MAYVKPTVTYAASSGGIASGKTLTVTLSSSGYVYVGKNSTTSWWKKNTTAAKTISVSIDASTTSNTYYFAGSTTDLGSSYSGSISSSYYVALTLYPYACRIYRPDTMVYEDFGWVNGTTQLNLSNLQPTKDSTFGPYYLYGASKTAKTGTNFNSTDLGYVSTMTSYYLKISNSTANATLLYSHWSTVQRAVCLYVSAIKNYKGNGNSPSYGGGPQKWSFGNKATYTEPAEQLADYSANNTGCTFVGFNYYPNTGTSLQTSKTTDLTTAIYNSSMNGSWYEIYAIHKIAGTTKNSYLSYQYGSTSGSFQKKVVTGDTLYYGKNLTSPGTTTTTFGSEPLTYNSSYSGLGTFKGWSTDPSGYLLGAVSTKLEYIFDEGAAYGNFTLDYSTSVYRNDDTTSKTTVTTNKLTYGKNSTSWTRPSAPSFTRQGYELLGWSTSATGTPYTWSSIMNTTSPPSTVYAIWKRKSSVYIGINGAWKQCAVYYGVNGQWKECQVRYGNSTWRQ